MDDSLMEFLERDTELKRQQVAAMRAQLDEAVPAFAGLDEVDHKIAMAALNHALDDHKQGTLAKERIGEWTTRYSEELLRERAARLDGEIDAEGTIQNASTNPDASELKRLIDLKIRTLSQLDNLLGEGHLPYEGPNLSAWLAAQSSEVQAAARASMDAARDEAARRLINEVFGA